MAKSRREVCCCDALSGARRSRWVGLLQIALLSFAPATAVAQTFPSRPITLIVPFPAGGPADIGARTVMQHISESIGQPVLVENRGGGGGQVGAAAVKIAAPDGYTLFLANIGTHAINQTLYAKLSYDPVKDFTPVSLMFSRCACSRRQSREPGQDSRRPGQAGQGAAGEVELRVARGRERRAPSRGDVEISNRD